MEEFFGVELDSCERFLTASIRRNIFPRGKPLEFHQTLPVKDDRLPRQNQISDELSFPQLSKICENSVSQKAVRNSNGFPREITFVRKGFMRDRFP